MDFTKVKKPEDQKEKKKDGGNKKRKKKKKKDGDDDDGERSAGSPGSRVTSEPRIFRPHVQMMTISPQPTVVGATTREATVTAMTEKRYSASFSGNISWTHGITGKPSLLFGTLRGWHRPCSTRGNCVHMCDTCAPRRQSIPPRV